MTTETLNGQEVLPLHPERCIYRGRLSRRGGWRMLPGGVKCARPGKWGNPWKVGKDGTAEECVARFRAQIRRCWLTPSLILAPLVARHREHGYIVLYCWCRLGDPCHCHPLADAVAKELERIANEKA